jgi:hypothetical protein
MPVDADVVDSNEDGNNDAVTMDSSSGLGVGVYSVSNRHDLLGHARAQADEHEHAHVHGYRNKMRVYYYPSCPSYSQRSDWRSRSR